MLQFIPGLRDCGLDVEAAPLLGDDYLASLYATGRRHIRRLLVAYVQRWRRVRHSTYDLVWLEKEVYPWLPAIAEKLVLLKRMPYVVDYDDATFHDYDLNVHSSVRWILGKKIASVMHNAATVTVGNAYLADYAFRANAQRVVLLPSVVDIRRYDSSASTHELPLKIGWIGTPITQRFLLEIGTALRRAASRVPIELVAIGAQDLHLQGVRVVVKPWSEDTEARELRDVDVGIMPLNDSEYARGKCGYKLIQYMAAGLPTIATPSEANQSIVDEHVTGLLPKSNFEWEEAIVELASDVNLRRQMGAAGRAKVAASYSVEAVLPRIAQVLSEAAEYNRRGSVFADAGSPH